MVRLLSLFVLVLAIAAGAVWLAEQPGRLTVAAGDLVIEMDLAIAALALIVAAGLAILFWRTYHWLVEAPTKIAEALQARRRRRGMEALSRGLIAAAAGDGTGAGRAAELAERQFGTLPLTLLLKAQSAQIAGDEAAARKVFDAMLDNPETEALGLRGLFTLARRAGDIAGARRHAERAARLKPDMPWASLARFELECAAGDWSAARTTLAERRRHRLVEPEAADRQRAVLLTAEAQATEKSAPDSALELAQEAHKLAPDLVPAAAIAARILGAKGEPRRAMRIVEKTWESSPHPDLADAHAQARPGDAAGERLKRMKALAARGGGEEAALALARAALEVRAFDEAKAALAPYLKEAPARRICTLMAEIAAAQGDQGRVREWLARAVGAARDPAWVADGHVAATWRAISPSGELDAYVWKVPPQSAGAPDTLEGRLAAAAALAPPQSAQASAGPPAIPTPEATGQDAAKAGAPATAPLPPVPDDPGVSAEEEGEEEGEEEPAAGPPIPAEKDERP